MKARENAKRLELMEDVKDAVRALPDHEKEVTEMFYLGGYSQLEIAKMVELSLTTVKKMLQYTLEILRLNTMATIPFWCWYR